MKKWIMTAVLILIAVGLIGCSDSKSGGKSENEIKTDLVAQQLPAEAYTDSEPPEITSFQILKRQTNVDDKTDLVYVTYTTTTACADFVRSYLLTYTLYNDGWILDDYEYCDGDYRTIPKVEPDDELVDSLFEYYDFQGGEYTNWVITERNVDVENGTANFTVQASQSLCDGYATTDEVYNIPLFFSEYGVWSSYGNGDFVSDSFSIDWSNLIGLTFFDHYYDETYITIDEYDDVSGEITLTLNAKRYGASTLVLSPQQMPMAPSEGFLNMNSDDRYSFYWSDGKYELKVSTGDTGDRISFSDKYNRGRITIFEGL